tara:strand:- start:1840 stop:2268 length:429 start_codon:yes stop_codon:yes gene_type:complete
MYRLYIIVILILIYFSFSNNNIEKFNLNFPENELKCKCDLENESIEKPNNKIENFSNYDNSEIKNIKRLNRIYNIYESPYDQTAESNYIKKYFYPIKPLSEVDIISSSNDLKYKNIGNSNHKILGNEYELNENISHYTFNLL